MSLKSWLWLLTSLGFECLGDIAIKKNLWLLALLGYNLMLLFWFKTVETSGQMITVPGTIWCIGGQIALGVLGIFLFKESLNGYQILGFFLGLASILCMAKS